MKRTLFLAHAEADGVFVRALAEFIEFGCDVICYVEEGAMPAGGNLLAKAEDGLAADVLALVLSAASCPRRWRRDEWEPILFDRTRSANVELITILLADCPFPDLLRRRNFFDARPGGLSATRLLKQWLWQAERGLTTAAAAVFPPDLEHLYAAVADRGGVLTVGGSAAAAFAREAACQFEAVFWLPCHRRTLAQAAGELGFDLGLTLAGTAEQNCRKMREILSARRCLLVLDAPTPEVARHLTAGGRSSTLVTDQPVKRSETPESLPYARTLLSAGRYAEAYELLYRLLGLGVAPEACARELTWICDRWDRPGEANSLRLQYGAAPSEQLTLF